MIVKCVICGKDIKRKKSHVERNKLGHTCSTECAGLLKSEKYKGSGNHQYGLKGSLNSSHLSDFTYTTYGYISVHASTHPYCTKSEFMLFHRLVIEEHLLLTNPDSEFLTIADGRKVLRNDIEVHHIDEKRINNTISNLQCMTHSEHVSYHNKNKPIKREKDGRFMNIGKKLKNDGKIGRSKKLDAGQDICSYEDVIIKAKSSAIISTNVYLALPHQHVGLLWSRSGLSVKHNIEVGAGCIDENFRGEIKVHLYNHGENDYEVKKGDKIAQLLIIPINLNNFIEVEELEDTERGENGFGSSGR